MDYSNLFVCLMGIGTVFIGLVCIIILVSVMSGIVRRSEKAAGRREQAPYDPSRASEPVIRPSNVPEKVTPELIAAVSAAIAEDMGADVGAIRILSIRQI